MHKLKIHMDFRFSSTRGKCQDVSFMDALMMGLATDGGLLVPNSVPKPDAQTIDHWRTLTSYPDLACAILRLLISESDIDTDTLTEIVHMAYSTFSDADIAPLRRVPPPTSTKDTSTDARASGTQGVNPPSHQNTHDPNSPSFLLELFHGPTASFKDMAMQLMGGFLDAVLKKRNQKGVVICATSGDTGSAAIEGFRRLPSVHVVVLYPQGRISKTQELQMTTAVHPNVHCVCVDGTFDACQAIVKDLLASPLREQATLISVNSINIIRIYAQILYYWHACLEGQRVMGINGHFDFAVPTGNFGSILSAYYAKSMGAPISHLLLSSNANDTLPRCLHTGRYRPAPVHGTVSPAMDIQNSSNFERLIFELSGRDAPLVRACMESLETAGEFRMRQDVHEKFTALFSGYTVSDEATVQQMRETYDCHGMCIDPHTAVAWRASMMHGERNRSEGNEGGADHPPCVVVSTAHPLKFPETLRAAIGGDADRVTPPQALKGLENKETRYAGAPADPLKIKNLILRRVLSDAYA
eukprot:GHVO01025794.1.p1 GENE.GHVO01025794.1~~GHVO01025794.1.p1  ORF type:complete len:527 (+),score=114.98 GHVO01025794.1:111-1691(+)